MDWVLPKRKISLPVFSVYFLFGQDALVRQAGGYMLETLPDASEETEKTVINNIAKLLARVRLRLRFRVEVTKPASKGTPSGTPYGASRRNLVNGCL